MRQGRCYGAVRQTCEALMLAETVVYMDRVFDSTFFSGVERQLQR